MNEIIISLILIVVLIFIINPLDFFMPSMLQLTLAGLMVVLFGFFASLIMKEKVSDEREFYLRSFAGRNAFLVGSVIIILGMIVGIYNHNLDPWLPVSLVSMIIAKLTTRYYMQ